MTRASLGFWLLALVTCASAYVACWLALLLKREACQWWRTRAVRPELDEAERRVQIIRQATRPRL